MKAKLKDNFFIDENHTLIAGAEVEITEGWCGCDGYYYNCILPDNEQMYLGGNYYANTQHVINDNMLEITDRTTYVDWKQVRIQASIAAMQGFCANSSIEMQVNDMARLSVEQADALIKELKKTM